jgi:hypothetical protein
MHNLAEQSLVKSLSDINCYLADMHYYGICGKTRCFTQVIIQGYAWSECSFLRQ